MPFYKFHNLFNLQLELVSVCRLDVVSSELFYRNWRLYYSQNTEYTYKNQLNSIKTYNNGTADTVICYDTEIPKTVLKTNTKILFALPKYSISVLKKHDDKLN